MGFRHFHTGDTGSVGQRASKLLAVKVGGLKKKSATWAPAPLEPVGPESRLHEVKSFSKVDGW